MCQYYDAHISDCFDDEKMSKMTMTSIPDFSLTREDTEKEPVEDIHRSGQFRDDAIDVMLLRSLTLWERQEVFVMHKYLMEELSIVHNEWHTWGWGKAPLEEWESYEREISHTFTPRGE